MNFTLLGCRLTDFKVKFAVKIQKVLVRWKWK